MSISQCTKTYLRLLIFVGITTLSFAFCLPKAFIYKKDLVKSFENCSEFTEYTSVKTIPSVLSDFLINNQHLELVTDSTYDRYDVIYDTHKVRFLKHISSKVAGIIAYRVANYVTIKFFVYRRNKKYFEYDYCLSKISVEDSLVACDVVKELQGF
jgi:hypothetical protein